ncbi:hypothetical protein D3C86_2088110 [compost metagenome]
MRGVRRVGLLHRPDQLVIHHGAAQLLQLHAAQARDQVAARQAAHGLAVAGRHRAVLLDAADPPVDDLADVLEGVAVSHTEIPTKFR